MTASMLVSTMTATAMHIITAKLRRKPVCFRCTKDIAIGQKFLSKRSGKSNRRHYHIDCAKQVNLL